jgi:uncharacterized protein (DUF736 family)
MAYEIRDYTGSLFKNDRKESDNHPDYKGTAMVGGVEMWMDAWIKKKEGAKTYMSVSFKPKEARQAQAPSRAVHPADDMDVPF